MKYLGEYSTADPNKYDKLADAKAKCLTATGLFKIYFP